MEFFGAFNDIKEKNLENTVFVKFYEDYFTTIYDKLCDKEDYDVEMYLRQAAVAEGKILELACGSGRISLKLLKAGYNVVCIDISRDMLDLLEKKLNTIPKRLRRNIEIHQKNMLNLDFDKKFNLVILPATTICLISDEEIQILFNEVYKVLEPGGRFVFDYYSYDFNVNYLDKVGDLNKFLYENKEQRIKQYVLYQEKLDYSMKKSTVNFYVEEINGDGKIDRFLSCTEKKMRNDEVIEEAISKTNFKKIMCDEFSMFSNLMINEAGKLKYFILEKPI